jgi:thymidylate synthase (FAD)
MNQSDIEVQYVDHMGTDKSVVRAARVSFAQDDNVDFIGPITTKDVKLINYLASHKHWTPLAHTSITIRVKAPLPIRTQCMKHAVGFVINEESRRYVSYTPEYFVPEFRMQCTNKKQGSGSAFEEEDQVELKALYEASVKAAIATYEGLLERGVAEEQARFVLPQGCLVNWYWTGSLAAFARFYNQRTDSHAQLEIQELAKEVGKIIQPLFPVSWEALTGVTS